MTMNLSRLLFISCVELLTDNFNIKQKKPVVTLQPTGFFLP